MILRHGKSSWATAREADHDRPLKGRGERDAERVGREIRQRDLTPDLILSSTALRAGSTAERAAEAAGYKHPIVKTRELYLTTVQDQFEAIAENTADVVERVMIVGHNPTSEDVVATLTGESVTMTTANLACIDLEIATWAELPGATGSLRFLLRPKELGPG